MGKTSYVKVAKVSDIPQDTGYLVEIRGKRIALFRVGSEIHAIEATCSHQGGPLHEGGIDGKDVTCPWHGWEFDVVSGCCV